MSRRLPFDVERCHGSGCPIRDQCARYNQRDNVGPRTPYRPGFTGDREPLLPEECDRFEPEDEL